MKVFQLQTNYFYHDLPLEEHFGDSVLTSCVIMLGFGVMCALGALVIERLRSSSVLKTAMFANSLLMVVGAISFVLGFLYPENLWAGDESACGHMRSASQLCFSK